MRIAKVVGLVMALVVLSGCAASGPPYLEVVATFPPVPQYKGRVFIYRPHATFGDDIAAEIHVNGRTVGSSQAGGFFYVDVEPGQCTVATPAEVGEPLRFTLLQGQTVYVRISASFGAAVGRIKPVLRGPADAMFEIQDLYYTGAKK